MLNLNATGRGIVDLIASIRQMMAEARFFEAEKLAEINLNDKSQQVRNELLEVYLESLKSQNKNIPEDFVIELIELNFKNFYEWKNYLNESGFHKNSLKI